MAEAIWQHFSLMGRLITIRVLDTSSLSRFLLDQGSRRQVQCRQTSRSCRMDCHVCTRRVRRALRFRARRSRTGSMTPASYDRGDIMYRCDRKKHKGGDDEAVARINERSDLCSIFHSSCVSTFRREHLLNSKFGLYTHRPCKCG